MAADVKILGRVRKLLEAIDIEAGGVDQRDLVLSQQLELLVAAGAAPYQEIVRAGRAFWTGTTTAVAGVIAIPTTAVMFALFNNDVDGGRSLIIDWLAAQNVVSTGVATQAQMLGLIGQVRETAPTDAALIINKRNGLGGGANDTKVRTILTATPLPGTTGAAGKWFPIGMPGIKTGVAATPGYGMYQQINGDIIVPPGRYFAMHVLSSALAETFQGFIGWHEKQITLG